MPQVQGDTGLKMRDNKLNVLILADALDGHDVGEVFSAFKWVEALCDMANVTVLATARAGKPLALQLPKARVITWNEPKILYQRFERINAMIKPWFPVFSLHIIKWLRAERRKGAHFDIAHQIVPQAMRHSCPLWLFDIPYIIGPLGGGLETPVGFRAEVQNTGITKLRAFDRLRLRYDPILRRSYKKASLLLGVAPYIGDILRQVGLGDIPFKSVLERGHGVLPPVIDRQTEKGVLRLLHVGRTIRTKGLREVIRAMAHLKDMPDIHLVSVGDGPDLDACREEAERLGVSAQITFLGRIARDKVDEEYTKADIFCFPSFREPMGGVFFEAMEYGLPVIAAAYGGPDFIVDESSGIRLNVDDAQKFTADIATAIRSLALDPERRLRLGAGARQRILSLGSWEGKAKQTLELYHQVISGALNDKRLM